MSYTKRRQLAMQNNVASALSFMNNGVTFSAPFSDKGGGEVSLIASGAGASQAATFTRALDTATTVNSSGQIISVAANIPRSYYDPTTLEYRGYLAEGARTNLLLNSLIDGTNLATQDVVVTAVAHTLSFYGTGTVTLSGASTAGPLVGTGNYPERVSLTFTPSAATLTLTVSGDVKFANLEVGSFASTFIPTAGAAVTRNADVLTYPFAGNADATVGTAYAELSTEWATSSAASDAIGFGSPNQSALYLFNGASATDILISDSTNFAVKSGLASMNSGLRKRASSWGGAGLLVTGDGVAAGTGTFDGAMASTAIGIGCAGDGSASAQWFGTIKNARILLPQFSAAQLQIGTNG